MCTAVFIDGLFGRTLDLEYSNNECVTVVPGNFDLNIEGVPPTHLGFVGMSHVADGYPLMYDGMNEAGLCAAALNFPGCARYNEPKAGKRNIASFELLPQVLALCGTANQAAELLKNVNITDRAFSAEYPPTPLHWMIADKNISIVAEQTKAGFAVYENRPGVMTNSPAFPEMLMRLADHMHISPCAPVNTIAPGTALAEYSRGMGALGLPGDFSSGSRFVRAAFAANNSHAGPEHEPGAVRFFHIMDMLGVPRGLCRLNNGKSVITVYTSCCDMERGEYLFTTYGCRSIRGVRLKGCNLDSDRLTMFPAAADESIMYLN